MKSIIDHAATSSVEVCGFVYIENGEIKTEPAKNIAVYESGKLAAIYHTHPKTEEDESKFDRFNCENSCIPYLIYSKQTEKFNLIVPKVPHVKKEYIEMLKKYYD